MFKKFLAFLKGLLPFKFEDGLKVPPEIQREIDNILKKARESADGLLAEHSVKAVQNDLGAELAAVDAHANRCKQLLMDEAAWKVEKARAVLPPLVLPPDRVGAGGP